ncbi:unnamed protein product [Staurois parvus]|uniref:Uncharacterized protein n=1 Tax=Staurois parvus TaxID=386267 RepID=A0ABN9CWS2_9NEOB|nr:unnamed protein product [Staurois parvus]
MNHGRRVLRWQADRFGYWQDGTGCKEFSPFPGFSYRSTVNGAAEDREELGGWNRGGSSCYRGLLYRVKRQDRCSEWEQRTDMW